MDILLISHSKEFYLYTKELVKDHSIVKWCAFSEVEEIIQNKENIDIAIVDFDNEMVGKANYKIIIELRGKFTEEIPILAVLENCTIQDIFAVLRLGALDYIEKEKVCVEYEKKLREMKQWKWYLDLINRNQ